MLRKHDICMTTTDVHSIVRVVIINTMVLYVDNEDLDIHVRCDNCSDCIWKHKTESNQERHRGGQSEILWLHLLYIRRLFESYSKLGPVSLPEECMMRFITSRSPVKPQVVAESNQRHRLCTVRCRSFNQIRCISTMHAQKAWHMHDNHRCALHCPSSHNKHNGFVCWQWRFGHTCTVWQLLWLHMKAQNGI